MSAFVYFMTATLVSGMCLVLFLVLLARHGIAIGSAKQAPMLAAAAAADSDDEAPRRHSVPLPQLLRKLAYPASAIALSFCLTMVFPVFTQAIVSVGGKGRAYQPDVFIPTAFLLWNAGDLSGRIACGWELFTIRRPRLLLAAAVARAAFVPLYFMCNVGGAGAAVNSDVFYWAVQLGFGFTSGWIGSSCMIVAPDYVDENEKEACGGFMGLMLVLGLALGSLMSFFVLNS